MIAQYFKLAIGQIIGNKTFSLINLVGLSIGHSTEISWWIFIIAGGLSMLVPAIAVAFYSIRIAFTKPIDSLSTTIMVFQYFVNLKI